MSQHNELKQFPKLTQAYQLATGLAENEEGVVRLGETMTPIVNIWDQPEWALLRGEQHHARRLSQAATGAGRNTFVAIVNPTGSGIVVVVTGISAIPGAAGSQLSLLVSTGANVQASALATTFGTPVDRRLIGGAGIVPVAQSIAQVIAGDSAGLLGSVVEAEVQRNAALNPLSYMTPWILWANDAILVQTNTANESIALSYRWYERKCVTNEVRGGR